MKLSAAQRFALDQISRHGVAHSTRSMMALERRGLVQCTGTDDREWFLTHAGKEAQSEQADGAP